MAEVITPRGIEREFDRMREEMELVCVVRGPHHLAVAENPPLSYLGNLEDMRGEVVEMIQHYEGNEKVLKRLLTLFDSIEASLSIQNIQLGFHMTNNDNGGISLINSTNNEIPNNGHSHSHIANEIEEGQTDQQASDQLERELTSALAGNQPVVTAVSPRLDACDFIQLLKEKEDKDMDMLQHLNGALEISVSEDEILSLLSFCKPSSSSSSSSSSSTNVQKVTVCQEGEQLNVQRRLDEVDSLLQALTIPLADSSEPSSSSSSSSSTPSTPSSPSSEEKRKEKKGKNKDIIIEPVVCKICFEYFEQSSHLHTLKCGHMYPQFRVLIDQGAVLDLTCPQPGCRGEITSSDVQKLADEEHFGKYERFVILAALRADPNVRWCPNPICSNPVKGPPVDPSVDYVVCNSCGLNICFKCGDERHDPAQCGKEAQELLASRHSNMRDALNAFQEWRDGVKERVKQCPGCKGFIEKNLGCNHMTCKACKFQFCWLCGNKYERNHYSLPDFPDCYGKQYWSPPLPPIPPDPELQKKTLTPPRKSTTTKKMKKIGVYVGMGFAVATLGVPAAIIGGPIYGVFKLHKRLKAKKNINNGCMAM